MTSTELITGDEAYFENQFKVVSLYVQAKQPTTIAKELGMRRVEVLKYIEEWRKSTAVNDIMSERVDELIQDLDLTYDQLIGKAWEIINDIDAMSEHDAKDFAQKNAALKSISEFTDKRIQVYQRAGIAENDAMAQEMAELERQKDIILSILKNDLCEKCNPMVQQKIGELLRVPQAIVVYDE